MQKRSRGRGQQTSANAARGTTVATDVRQHRRSYTKAGTHPGTQARQPENPQANRQAHLHAHARTHACARVCMRIQIRTRTHIRASAVAGPRARALRTRTAASICMSAAVRSLAEAACRRPVCNSSFKSSSARLASASIRSAARGPPTRARWPITLLVSRTACLSLAGCASANRKCEESRASFAAGSSSSSSCRSRRASTTATAPARACRVPLVITCASPWCKSARNAWASGTLIAATSMATNACSLLTAAWQASSSVPESLARNRWASAERS
eukprot:2246586-Pleurochrysis_carterae.AAC.2